LPEKRHLFSKNISDYLIRAYKELYKGISITFKAIPVSIATGTGLIGNVQEFLVLAEVYKQLKFLNQLTTYSVYTSEL
jgi:hypothetical protein